MYKKNSILDRPVRPCSARNVEHGPVEHAAAIDKQRRLTERKHRFRDREGFACRHEWTQHRGDICHRHTGVAKIPAPWDRLENYERDDPLAAVSWPASPVRVAFPKSVNTPFTAPL